jgi:hypothetical protein
MLFRTNQKNPMEQASQSDMCRSRKGMKSTFQKLSASFKEKFEGKPKFAL